MLSYSFSKLIPGGNPTIILHDPDIPDGTLPGLSARLMHPMHLHAEQVGALYSGQAHEWSPDQPDWPLPRLEMMGGEFCVNATRAAAFCLTRQGSLPRLAMPEGETPVWHGALQVSGMAEPVRVLASADAASLDRAMEMPVSAGGGWKLEGKPAGTNRMAGEEPARLFCAALVSCADAVCRQVQKGVSLVDLPGMSHLLVDMDRHPLPDLDDGSWKRESAAWRTLCGLTDSPASGVVWYKAEGEAYRIWPAVEVKATASEHLESACGSASLALALTCAMPRTADAAAPLENAGEFTVVQPSGESLRVRLQREPSSGAFLRTAWISGPVLLAARGDVFF